MRLTYNGPAAALPGSLIVKTGLPERQESEWTQGSHEIAFYNDVAPSLPEGLVPRCFAACRADTTTPHYLVLEDLTDTHTVATEWPLPPTEAQSRTILTALGRLHAALWDDPRLGVSIGALLDEAAIDQFIQHAVKYFDVFADRLGDELSAERRGSTKDFSQRHPRYLNGIDAQRTIRSGTATPIYGTASCRGSEAMTCGG